MAVATAVTLAGAAGLNAYIPLLVCGILARFTGLAVLPEQWEWLEHPAFLVILGVLLTVELVADKIPVVDSINDVLQTLVRPTSGGIVFASGLGPGEVLDDSGELNWVAIISGVVIALAIHVLKSFARPLIGGTTGGLGNPVVSTLEDSTSLTMSLSALVLPALAVVLLGLVVSALLLCAYRRWARNHRSITRIR